LTAAPPLHRRCVVVAGKGGVGRSTVAAVIALQSAAQGRRTCLLQFNTRDAIGPLFPGAGEVDYEPVRLHPALPLWAINLRPGPALREYGLMKLRFRALHRVVFENDVMRRLIDMIPGMSETFLLGKAWHMEQVERDAEGRPAWDELVLDAPATGHGLSLLRLPETLLRVIPAGPMAEDAQQMAALLSDPARTVVHIVALPAELPVTEALELERSAREELGVPLGLMVLNRCLPDLLLAPGATALAEALGRFAETEAAGAAQRDAAANVALWQAQRAQQGRWRGLLGERTRLPRVELPWLLRGVDEAGLQALGAQLAAASAPQPGASLPPPAAAGLTTGAP
jgi:anion-transporting  ArsA/GET3 family ATPase